MGIPLKKSRKIEVEGQTFYYMIKETHIPEHKDQLENAVTVQGITDGEKKPSGQVFQFRAPYGLAVTPLLMHDAIRRALSEGWLPGSKNNPFVLDLFL